MCRTVVRCVAGQADKDWLRDHRDRAEEREGGGALVHRAHRAKGEGLEKELTKEQLAAKAAARKAKKTRQKARRAKEAGERAESEAERAEPPRAAQLRANIQYVMAGLRTAAAQTRGQAGSNIGVEYSLPPERGRVSTRPQQAVRHGSPGDRGDDGRTRLARERAGRARQD